MNIKIISIGIVSAFVLTAFFSASVTGTKIIAADDELDQYEDNVGGSAAGSLIWLEHTVAQSFKPTVKTLTRVEVYVYGPHYYEPKGNLKCAIKEELKGSDLTYMEKTPEEVYEEINTYAGIGWLEFDLPDISIIPEKTYYIVLSGYENDDSSKWHPYAWFKNEDPTGYLRGTSFHSDDQCKSWKEGYYDCHFRTYGLDKNSKPDKPEINGPASGLAGIYHKYHAKTLDVNGDEVSFLFDWGDGTNSGWLDYVSSGEEVTWSKCWTSKGIYEVKVKAKDIYGAESDWATLQVHMPRDKPLIIQKLQIFFEKWDFPLLTRLLNH